MDIILLTKSTTPVIGWITELLGYVMDFLFNLTTKLGIGNTAVCIFLFTVIVNILLLPLTIKQQKSQKIMNIMQPELQAVQKKYAGKTDQTSQAKLQAETQAVYEKYGYSVSGGCVQLLIQMPILIALYQVIYRIPAYVTAIYDKLLSVANQIMTTGFETKIAELLEATNMTKQFDPTKVNTVIDFLYKLSREQWQTLAKIFPDATNISSVSQWLGKVNSIFGIDLASAPWQGFDKPSWAWLIPILAGLTQWLSVKLMNVGQAKQPEVNQDENPIGNTMKGMNTIMPIMSAFICLRLPAGLGFYWIVSAVVRIVIQIGINLSLKNVDPDEIVKKNLEKVNAKRAKKGLPPKTLDKKAILSAEKEEAKAAIEEARQEKLLEKSDKMVEESNKYYNFDANPDSISARANMVAMMNQREWEKKHRKKDVSNNEETKK